jgi:hypothetical protein
MEPSGRNRWQPVANGRAPEIGPNGLVRNRWQPPATVQQRMVRRGSIVSEPKARCDMQTRPWSERVTPNQHPWGSPSRSRSGSRVNTGFARRVGLARNARRNTMARLVLADCCSLKQQKSLCAGLFDGRYWARTSDPQLVDSGQRSRPFAQVRSTLMVERIPCRERMLERTRTNAEPCHSCHAAPTRLAGARFEIRTRFG